MKKIVLTLIMVWILPLSVQAGDFVFDKGISWDMSQKEVLKVEKKAGSKIKNKSADVAEVEAGDYKDKKVRLTYQFGDNGLEAVTCIIRYPATVSNAQIYYNDYLDIVGNLTDAYGKPKTEELRWKISDSTLKSGFEDQNKIGLAVSMGYLEVEAFWELEEQLMTIRVELFRVESLKAAIKISYKKLS